MIKSEIKIIVSEASGAYSSDIKTQSIEGLDSVKFSNNLGGGMGEVDLKIMTNYDNLAYSEQQLVEIAFYNPDYPAGFLQYSGFIKNINRSYDQDNSDSVELEILGIGSLLGEYKGTLNMTGALNTVIDSLIASFHSQYNISTAMEFLGSSIFKNGITATTSVTVNKTGSFFDILKEIFDSISRTFFVSKNGTIYLGNQSTTEHLLTINKDIINIKISSSRETEITLTGNTYDIEPGDKISILNVNSNFNMDGKRVEKVELGLFDTRIYLGKVWSIGQDIISEGVQFFSDLCDSLTGWTNSGVTVTANGTPTGNCFTVGLLQHAHKQNTLQNIDFTYEFDVIVNTVSIIDFYFGCDANGVGYMFRVDTRAPGAYFGLLPTTSWTSWNSPLVSTGSGSSGIWYKAKVQVTADGTIKCYINNSLVITYSGAQINGNWIGVQGDGTGTGGRVDNIIGY